ncbi:cobalt-precorrin-6A reductase [Methylocystis sp. ATCC 49242]|uniref:cobalt-precorrin-6A reductase n=1 Tax=Methylocystis sp. ATCC 49242 TaxID=622637 RepID=UPI0001F879F9|nr:cobalt-precorrin-6A reductase [Methylocystis sp. ATCC 49242]
MTVLQQPSPLTRAAVAPRRRVLLLGGTSEGRALAGRIAADPRYEGVASLAGRTSAPMTLALPTRVGGFGGAEGLMRYLAEERVERVIDATHPFAAQISENARMACEALGIPLLVYAREPWRPEQGDRWIEVEDNAAAARALGETPRRVFLTIGRQGAADFRAAPWHDYLLRVIEPPRAEELPPKCEVTFARGPFTREEEIALMRERRIDLVVSKNSGGALTHAKIEAARELGLTVVMIRPPERPGVAIAHDLDAAMAFLAS